MTPSTGGEVFDYRLTPFGKGSINANCAIEIGGRHYVFGVNDIWMHDGVSHQSICDRRRGSSFSARSTSRRLTAASWRTSHNVTKFTSATSLATLHRVRWRHWWL
jgi:hypothetical protein